MKQITEHLKPTTQESSEPFGTGLDRKVLDRLFAVFTTIYGQKWTSLIVDDEMLNDMQKTWGYYLRDTDPQTIKSALDKISSEFPEWPPTVGQFLEVCKIGKDPDMQPKLPKPRGDETIALEALDEINKILKQ